MDTLKQYIQLCWFRNNPLELKRSASLFKKNLLFSFIIEYLMQANMTDDPLESFYEVTFETLLTLFFIGVILFFNKTLYAYIQVSTAILVCANVVSLFIVPVAVWLTVSEDALSYYVLSLLVIWDYALVTYIFKQTLNINLPASIALALLYFTLTYFGAFALGQMI
ncbi:MAG: hypothetical protein HOP23_02290 [Methylococcaceae bacterium]|nr:hypothetical protein [Methylococcaceae bacterium]